LTLLTLEEKSHRIQTTCLDRHRVLDQTSSAAKAKLLHLFHKIHIAPHHNEQTSVNGTKVLRSALASHSMGDQIQTGNTGPQGLAAETATQILQGQGQSQKH